MQLNDAPPKFSDKVWTTKGSLEAIEHEERGLRTKYNIRLILLAVLWALFMALIIVSAVLYAGESNVQYAKN